MLLCFKVSLKVFFLRMTSFCQAGQGVEISPRVSVRLATAASAAAAAADDVYLAALAGISKHSTLPSVGSSNTHILFMFRLYALWHNYMFIFVMMNANK